MQVRADAPMGAAQETHGSISGAPVTCARNAGARTQARAREPRDHGPERRERVSHAAPVSPSGRPAAPLGSVDHDPGRPGRRRGSHAAAGIWALDPRRAPRRWADPVEPVPRPGTSAEYPTGPPTHGSGDLGEW